MEKVYNKKKERKELSSLSRTRTLVKVLLTKGLILIILSVGFYLLAQSVLKYKIHQVKFLNPIRTDFFKQNLTIFNSLFRLLHFETTPEHIAFG